MKKWCFYLLAAAVLMLPLALQAGAEEEDGFTGSGSSVRAGKDKGRNVRKAASRKKRELREMGVRNVRVKNPGDWPRQVSVPKETEVKELGKPQGKPGFLYESNNYCYVSPVKLPPSAQQTVARLCECAYAANKAIAEVLPVHRTTLDRGNKKFAIVLQPTKAAYLKAGGPEGSAGVFQFVSRGRTTPGSESAVVMDRVMIPFESLGLTRSGAVQREDIDTHALVHELTHQQFMLNRLPIWANEGWAEYVGYVPYVGEDLDFDRGFSLILHEARKRVPFGALDFDFKLEDFLTMDQQTMYGYMGQRKDTYMLSVMTIAFFVHLDGKRGIDAMKAYLQALLDGKSPQEAAEVLIKPYHTAARLQNQFVRAWRGKKVKVGFPKK